MKHVKILDWRADNFKLARDELGLSLSEVLDYIRGPYELEDIQDSEFMDAYMSVKDELAHIYNELFIAEDLGYRFQSTYVLYDKLPPKPEV